MFSEVIVTVDERGAGRERAAVVIAGR